MKIVSDTASLFSVEKGRTLGVTIVPACVICDGTVYRDYEEITMEGFLDLIQLGYVPTTSQPAIGDLIDTFEGEKEEILGLFIGDGLSGGYQNAVGAKNSMDEHEHIRILDTKTLAGAEHYLVEKAARLNKAGFRLDAIEKELQESINSSASFVIPADFEFLKRSGRLTPLAAKVSSLIKIVPVMTQTENKKKITLFTIKRSWKKAIAAILDEFEKIGVNEDYIIYVCHGGDLKNAELVREKVKERFQGVDTVCSSLSPTMMTHGGPGCVLLQTILK